MTWAYLTAISTAASRGLLLALLLIAVLLGTRHLLRAAVQRRPRTFGWNWSTMRGPSPMPSPRWVDGVFLQRRTRNRAPAICVRVHTSASPTNALASLSHMQAAALTWHEPELFCIDALFASAHSGTILARGGTRMFLRLSDHARALGSDTIGGGRYTTIEATFIPSNIRHGNFAAELDTLHAPLGTWIFSEYAKRGYSEAQMLDVEHTYRTAASWMAEVVTALGVAGMADAVSGANLADLVSRRA